MAKIKYKPIPQLSDSDKIRFWSKVDKSPGQGPKGECWGWMASKSKDGYGYFGITGFGLFKSNRIAYFLQFHEDPFGFEVCHSCDWPPCCRHLFKGTHKENMLDSLRKGTHAIQNQAYREKFMRAGQAGSSGRFRGEKNPKSKITAEDVVEIRRLLSTGRGLTSIARLFSISATNVRAIGLRETWKHVG